MEILNQARGHFFLLGMLRNQQTDPYCSSCSAFANTLRKVREDLAAFDTANRDALRNLPPDFLQLYGEARSGLDLLQPPAEPSGQKKAGNCRLPEGLCFIKSSSGLVQKI